MKKITHLPTAARAEPPRRVPTMAYRTAARLGVAPRAVRDYAAVDLCPINIAATNAAAFSDAQKLELVRNARSAWMAHLKAGTLATWRPVAVVLTLAQDMCREGAGGSMPTLLAACEALACGIARPDDMAPKAHEISYISKGLDVYCAQVMRCGQGQYQRAHDRARRRLSGDVRTWGGASAEVLARDF